MKPIFECETVLGHCDGDRLNGHFGDETGEWIAVAFTTAALSGTQGVLKIEQRCYIRSVARPEEIRDQAWVRPEMLLEPVSGSKQETVELSQCLHQRFVEAARTRLAEDSILAMSEAPPPDILANS